MSRPHLDAATNHGQSRGFGNAAFLLGLGSRGEEGNQKQEKHEESCDPRSRAVFSEIISGPFFHSETRLVGVG